MNHTAASPALETARRVVGTALRPFVDRSSGVAETLDPVKERRFGLVQRLEGRLLLDGTPLGGTIRLTVEDVMQGGAFDQFKATLSVRETLSELLDPPLTAYWTVVTPDKAAPTVMLVIWEGEVTSSVTALVLVLDLEAALDANRAEQKLLRAGAIEEADRLLRDSQAVRN